MTPQHDPGRSAASPRSRTIEAVVFDVGETLVDESIEYHGWADWLGVPRHTFSAVFGGVVVDGRDHLEVFEYFKPGFDLEYERRARAEAGRPEGYSERDFYPDARPTMAALHDAGYLVSTWTVDSPSHTAYLLDAGVDALITNRIDRLVRLIAARTEVVAA